MKKLLLVTLISFISFAVLSQSCLPEGITFTTQAQIDNFQTDYPGCTEIEGVVTISGSDITNLNGLSVLTSFGNDLKIWDNPILTNLSGLENITSIASSLNIGEFDYGGNPSLTSLTGLDYLSSIGGWLEIFGNPLINLTGLGNLTTIGLGGLWIEENFPLENLTGLENLSNIGGELVIQNNLGLTSIVGLDHVISIDGYLQINNNLTLSTCEVQSICDYLAAPIGTIEIYNNALGCNSQEEVEEACSSCLPEGITFSTQEQIDNFQINYPGCTEILGDVDIYGNTIENLNGLSILTNIGGDLTISNANGLTSLTGLDNLMSIEGSLNYYGGNLTSLTGFEGLTSIGGSFVVWGTSLISLTGLEGLTSINGNIEIRYNHSLINLLGLDNLSLIDGSINFFRNDSLTNLIGLDNLTHIEGSLSFQGSNCLSNLMGLDNLTSIAGYLVFRFNEALTSFEGLESLTSVEGLIISGTALVNLTGLDGLTYISGGLVIGDHGTGGQGGNPVLKSLTGLERLINIGWLDINNNDSLTSLVGLGNVTSFVDYLTIIQNPVLSSLTGLDNIGADSITSLYISSNNSLSTCEVQSVCDYLVSPGGIIEISNNATGCDSQQEVEEACASSINEVSALYGIKIQPNPFSTSTTLSYELQQPEIVQLSIFNQLSQLVYQTQENQPQGSQKLIWNAEGYADGVYYYRLQVGEQVATGKLVKVK